MMVGEGADGARLRETQATDVADQRFGGFRLGYRPAFDGIRGIFVVIVLAVHATYLLVPRYAGLYVPGGFIAVDVFFVLSGFLITSLLLQEWDRHQRISLKKFYRRRALRLFPALWTVMAVHLVYTLIVHDPLGYELKGLAAIFFYVGNFSWKFGAIIPDAFGQTWSLAIEEQFYLLWPLALIALIRSRNRRLTIWVLCGLIVVAFVCRVVLWNVGVPWNKVYVQTEARFDTLMVGTLFAYLLHTGWRLPHRIGIYGAAGALFLAIVTVTAHREDSWMFDGGYTLVALASGLIVLAVLDQRALMGRVLSIRPLRVLGRLSYSLYVWHVFVFLAVERAWPTHSVPVRLAAGFGITALASAFSYYVIELPFLRRKGSAADKPAADPAGSGPAGLAGPWSRPVGGAGPGSSPVGAAGPGSSPAGIAGPGSSPAGIAGPGSNPVGRPSAGSGSAPAGAAGPGSSPPGPGSAPADPAPAPAA